MIDLVIKKNLEIQQIQMPSDALTTLLSTDRNAFVFVKNTDSMYQYANPSFLHLMGLQSNSDIYNKKDHDLCRNENKVKRYLQDDEYVLDSKLALNIQEDILPEHNSRITCSAAGTLFPLLSETNQIIGVMGVITLHGKPYRLTLEIAASLSVSEIKTLIRQRSYPICIAKRQTTLSKRELQCLIGIMQGKKAGEIATFLSLQQTTIEFYLENIKNKLGATSKSNLINIVFNHNILQQIIL